MTTALHQRNYAAANLAKGLCAQCTNSLAIHSKRFCQKHLNLKSARGKKYAQTERHKATRKQWYEALRLTVIVGLGGKCECCGEIEEKFLTLDHRNNDGYKDKRPSITILRQLVRDGFPRDVLRLLCFNCNCGRAKNNGVCPHEEDKMKHNQLSPAEEESWRNSPRSVVRYHRW